MRELVAIELAPGPKFVEELRRAWDAGDAVWPVDHRLAGPQRERLFAALRPTCLVGEEGERLALEDGEPVEDGDALVMATSGSTGEPKGAVLTMEAVASSARATSARLGVDAARDKWWACLPVAHVGGLSVITRSLLLEVPCDVVARFDPQEAEVALFRGATLTSLVPAALHRLEASAVRRWRRIVLGGQSPPPRLPENVVTTYGMTETGSGVVYDGVALEGVEVRTEAGRIFIRCPMLLRCYRDGTDPKDAQGWFDTGDAGGLDPDGRLRVLGRIGDLIVTGGENVWPATVEPVVSRHPAVSEVAVAGAPDPEWGERVVAYVVVSDDAVKAPELLSELREMVSGEVAGFAAPREVVLVASLPRTAIGKVRREELSRLEGPAASV